MIRELQRAWAEKRGTSERRGKEKQEEQIKKKKMTAPERMNLLFDIVRYWRFC
jgi:hypothetical protein